MPHSPINPLETLWKEIGDAHVPRAVADSDERLAIALDYEMLADFDVISNLELLEFLGELENVESM